MATSSKREAGSSFDLFVLLAQDHVAMAGVCVASVSGRRQQSSLQWHSDQPLLGPDVCILCHQVNPKQY